MIAPEVAGVPSPQLIIVGVISDRGGRIAIDERGRGRRRTTPSVVETVGWVAAAVSGASAMIAVPMANVWLPPTSVMVTWVW